MILSTLDKSRKGGAYEQIPSLVLGQRWTPQLNSRNMMKVVLCVWIEPYIENDLSFCVWPVHTPTTSKEVLTLSASTSPLPYTGNKSCIVNTILSVMPKHTVYIDPCMGSAEVFFRKPRAEKEILNDYNGDLVNLFRVIQNNEKLAYLLGRLYLSINGELAFKQNKDRLKGVPNILDDVIETSQIFYDASWEDIQNAAAFLENQVYSFSSTGQTFGIARRDMSQRLPRLMSAYNRIRDAIILHRDYKDVPDDDPAYQSEPDKILRYDIAGGDSFPETMISNTYAATEMTLRRFTSRGDATFHFFYDYGDGWEVVLRLEEVFEDSELPGKELPRVLEGQGFGIIEDCGGPAGLEHLREVFQQKSSPEYQSMREWLGTSEVDLSVFDLQDLNFRLKKLPRIFRDLYEYDYPPTKHSIDLLDRKYCKTN